MRKALAAMAVFAAALTIVSVLSGCQTPPGGQDEQGPPVEQQQPQQPEEVVIPDPPVVPDPEPLPPEPAPIGVDARARPSPFSPDGDGVDDVLYIEVIVTGDAPVASWRLVIRDAAPPHHYFYLREGEGAVPSVMTWDGVGSSGELVQSAMSYPFAIVVTCVYGETAVYEGRILVDLLVRDEGGVLRIVVPAIIFGPDRPDFVGVAEGALESNDRVLRRMTEVLQRFPDYRIRIEGHANPTTPPGTPARAEEEAGSPRILGLLPLSDDRAHYVLEYLVGLGVDRERLSAVGMGGTMVVAEYEDRDNWWKNRRVEFVLLGRE